MLNFLLAVTCFLPNATFVYNPITTIGILTATYLPNSSTNGYLICEKLDNHLARASVELAGNQEPVSANFQFRHGENIAIPITFSIPEQQESAIITAQSNFKIAMLDMDAEVKQTLAYFSVASYNSDNCLTSVTNSIVGNVMTITADQTGCDYSITLNGSPDSSFTPEQVNNTILARITCQEMNIQIPVGILLATPTDSIQVVFDCDLGNSAVFNRTVCLEMIKNFTYAPMTQSSFQLHYQLIEPQSQYFTVEQKFDAFIDPSYLDCYIDSSFQINGGIVILYFTPTGSCNFNTRNNQMIIALSDSQTLKLANQWVFTQTNYSFNSETIKLSVECSQLQMENCEGILAELNVKEEIYTRVKFIVYDGLGNQNFILVYPRRYQQCYQYAELHLKYVNGASVGSVELENRILGLSGCEFQYPTIMELTLHLYVKTIAGGLITDIEATPYFILNQRRLLSIQNKTVVYDDITELDKLKRTSSLINANTIYCIAYYDGLIVPVIMYHDDTRFYDNTYIYVITVAGGMIGGLVVGGIEFLLVRKMK